MKGRGEDEDGVGGMGCRLKEKRRPDVCDGLCGKLAAARAQGVWGNTPCCTRTHTRCGTRLTRGEPRRPGCHAKGQRAGRLLSARGSTDRIANDGRRGGGASAATVPAGVRGRGVAAPAASHLWPTQGPALPRRGMAWRRGGPAGTTLSQGQSPAQTRRHRPSLPREGWRTPGRSRRCRRTSITCG